MTIFKRKPKAVAAPRVVSAYDSNGQSTGPFNAPETHGAQVDPQAIGFSYQPPFDPQI